jgi:hypothetical protein
MTAPYNEQQSTAWEAIGCSASQEIFHDIWYPAVHHSVHVSPLLLHILSHMDSFCEVLPDFLTVRSVL